MGDHDRGAAFGNLVERRLDRLLGSAVERAGGFVEDQDRRVLEQGAGDCHALFFAARELEPALADHRLIAIRDDRDEAVDGGAAGGFLDHLLAAVGAAIADVVTDGVVEQNGVLGDDPDRRSKAFLGDRSNVLAVDGDSTAAGIVKSIQQPGDGRFAGARRTDDRATRPGRNVDCHAAQDLPLGLIAEIDILEADMARSHHQIGCSGPVFDLGRGIEQVEHRFHVDQPLADRSIDPAEHVERPEQLHQQAIDQNDIARGKPPLAPAPHGEHHRPGHHQIGDQRLADIEPGERHLILDRRLGKRADRLVVALGFAFLGAEIFDRFVIEQAVDGAADGAIVDLVHLPLELGAPVGHGAGEGDVNGDHDQRRGDQAGAELDQEDDADRSQFDDRRADVEQQEIQHHVDALGAAFDDLGQRSGAPLEVEAERQIVDMAEHLSGQPARCILTDLFEQGVAQIVRQHSGKARGGISKDHSDDDPGGGARPAHAVDHRLVGERHQQHRRLARKHQHDRANDPRLELALALWPQHRKEPQQDLEAAARL